MSLTKTLSKFDPITNEPYEFWDDLKHPKLQGERGVCLVFANILFAFFFFAMQYLQYQLVSHTSKLWLQVSF